MKAAVVQADHTAGIEEKPIPKLKANEILCVGYGSYIRHNMVHI